VLEDGLGQAGVFRYRPPAAGAILFARYELPIASVELAERLRVEQSVLIVPGGHFGMDSYLRFGFGMHADTLREALRRVSTCLDSLRVVAGDA
jgi:aspartate/methionine/tyrosine aminotransferase